MTIALCLLFAMGLFALVLLPSREVLALSRLPLNAAIHALSVAIILVALSTRGIWFHAPLYLGDIWTALDALIKTQQGLGSSIDYFSPIGPMLQWIYGLTLLIQPPATSSLVLGNVIFATGSLVFCMLLLRRRVNPITMAIVGLIAVTTALSPRDLDDVLPYAGSSMLAPYNRWGWALLLPVALFSALPSIRSDRVGSVLAGIAIALLAMLKITYGLAAIGMCAVALIIQPSRWRDTTLIALSCALTLVLADLVSGGQVRAYLGDLGQAARMPSNGLRIGKLLYELPPFIFCALASVVLLLAVARKEGDTFWAVLVRHWRALVLALAAGASGLVVLMQNHYATEASTLLLMPLIVLGWTGFDAGAGVQSHTHWRSRGEWLVMVLLTTLVLPVIDASFILAQKMQTMRKAAPTSFAGTPLHDLVIDESYLPIQGAACENRTCNDVRRMISGRVMIKKQCSIFREKAVLAFNFANPFPAFLPSQSPRHAPIWLHADRSFSANVHVPAAQILEDVGCVMIAKNESNAAALVKIYGDDLRRSFSHADEDEYWDLWVRK